MKRRVLVIALTIIGTALTMLGHVLVQKGLGNDPLPGWADTWLG